ncbi:carbohydrate-binding module family 20 domain-containing protein [Cellulosimicrobium protaetiae]|uniref:Alpha-amylase n=1 Tax=Cellulosimicrobium protaetiae TaxID=2587808 RepID=A0A6M5UFF7_9MICO|nr:carbohydrate-binding module family 20 domain-containing protein [Cellulosimicrobium protaetiae]QJW35995.1 alpha-amylase [Cellulosimicrobium protaetiae]
MTRTTDPAGPPAPTPTPVAGRSPRRTSRRTNRGDGRLRRLAAATASAALALGAVLAATAPVAAPAAAAPPVPTPVVDSPNGRGDVILNLFQWTWDSVAAECTSTIGPAGFGYVQVSPPQETIQGTAWWTSYQPVSYRIDSKLGTRAEFENMVDTCRAAGVGVVADAVLNHMAGADQGGGTGVAGSSYGVESYPGLYGPNDFNDCRSNISNYGDRYQVQNCRLVSLQDLRTGSEYVRGTIAGYLNDLLSLGVAGFRIDAAKHIPAADLAAIKGKLTNPNVFWVHEVIGAHGEPIQPTEYLGSGDSHEFHYGRDLKSRFDGQIKDLRTIGDGKLPSDRAGVFVDNHDTERNGETMSYKWGAKYKLANAFMLSWPYGAPSVYSGYTWTDKDAGAPGASATAVPDASCASSAWVCTQRWTEIAGMVGFHNAVAGTAVTNWWDDGNNHVAYGRGSKGYVTLNNTANAVTRTYQTSLPAGTYCDVVASKDCSKTVTVSGSGTFTATVPAYGALALHVEAADDGGTGGPGPVDPSGTTTVFYATGGWNAYNVHYRVGTGAWTAVPGAAMTAACTGWVSKEIALPDGATGPAATITAAFTNGSGSWDNNGGKDYSLSGAAVAVSGGTVTAGDPCDDDGEGPGPVDGQGDASFAVTATTTWGQGVLVVGSIPALGSWAPANGVALSAGTYPVWTATLDLPAGTSFAYKYVKRDGGGNIVWESGSNRTATVGQDGTVTLSDTWRS